MINSYSVLLLTVHNVGDKKKKGELNLIGISDIQIHSSSEVY